MRTLPTQMIRVLLPFVPLFSKRVFSIATARGSPPEGVWASRPPRRPGRNRRAPRVGQVGGAEGVYRSLRIGFSGPSDERHLVRLGNRENQNATPVWRNDEAVPGEPEPPTPPPKNESTSPLRTSPGS